MQTEDLEVLPVEIAMKYAKRVAYKMSRDPEAESYAHSATIRAIDTYRPATNVPFKRWLARCVKIAIWNWWRSIQRRHEDVVGGGIWDVNVIDNIETQSADLPIPREDWEFLHSYYIDRWPLDVMARRYGRVSVYAIKQRIRDTVARFADAMDYVDPRQCQPESDETADETQVCCNV
jgi:DNA-directed RNA polymerase specialized sigma24 family protein